MNPKRTPSSTAAKSNTPESAESASPEISPITPVPIQTIKFDRKVPAATPQLSLPQYERCGLNLNGPGWLMDIHGNMTFQLQLETVVAVKVTFEMSIWGGGRYAVYNVVLNNQMLIHRQKFDDGQITPHVAILPADRLQAGANSFRLELSAQSDSPQIDVKSVTVQSNFDT